MFILAYLWLAALVWILALAVVRPARLRFGRYSAFSVLLALTGLILFIVFSSGMGLIRFGVPYTSSIPEDYVLRGALGVAVLLIGMVGAISPAIAAWVVSRQPGSRVR